MFDDKPTFTTAAFHFVDPLMLRRMKCQYIVYTARRRRSYIDSACHDQKVATTSITNKTMLEDTYDRLSKITKKITLLLNLRLKFCFPRQILNVLTVS